VDNILIIDKLVYRLNNKIEISKSIFQELNQHLEVQVLVEEKGVPTTQDNIKLRMHKWPVRQFMVENLINDNQDY